MIRAPFRGAAGAVLILAATAAQAQPLFDAATRATLGAEIRALLLEEPGIVARALTPPGAYDAAVAADLDRLTQLAPRLFATDHPGFGAADAARRIAFFTTDDCADCAAAEADLRDLAATHDLRVTVFALSDPAARDLAAQLGLTETPAYVLPGMMLQGHMPPMVLDRYLRR
jgi:hypothetical protein